MLEFSNRMTWPMVPAAPELVPALTCSCAVVQFGVVGCFHAVLSLRLAVGGSGRRCDIGELHQVLTIRADVDVVMIDRALGTVDRPI